ncbi:hypothetical protein PNP85_06580 [Halobacterium salinarum]|uniref:hypothetical protein n=1 Tax=Halobacterium salinarum TaxID=2242 RepID=UPI0025573124|nr:hypothetical protein [Halobacterium salinarum]MDL0136476.1 hypothetical protein [Halobacterium salinarum]MDL0139166.1 hypothetical protein [Halobacterium salinarum]
MSNRSQFVPSWLVPEAAGDLPLTVSRLSLLALAAAFAVGYGAGFAVPLEVQAGVYLLEPVIESVTYEAAGCGKCVQHNRNPARCGFGRRLLECRGYRDSPAVRAP